MNKAINQLNQEWADRWPAVSGQVVIELEEKTGESPSRRYIDEIMYLKIKEYWSNELSTEQLNKLNNCSKKVST